MDLVLEKAAHEDIAGAFGLLRKIYSDIPEFRPDCHSFTIELTKQLYEIYPRYGQFDITPEMVSCNYGFLQQYPTSILTSTKDIQKAQEFCGSVKLSIGEVVPGAEAECYRGIGRGLPFVDSSVQGDPAQMAASAVRICREIALDPNDRGTCLSGVFNMIGRAEIDGSAGLSIEASDPMSLCKVQTDPEVQGRCFGNFKATVISMVSLDDPATAERDILRLYGEDASTTVNSAMWTIGYEWARRKLVRGDPVVPAITACAALSGPYMHDCIQGVSVGIAKHGIPGAQHVLMTSFCAAARTKIPALLSEDCPSAQAVGYIRGFYSPQVFQWAYGHMKLRLGMVVLPDDTTFGF